MLLLVACAVDRDADDDGSPVPMDCDDADPAVHPGAGETCADGVDDDCDGMAAGCGPAGTVDLRRAEARIVVPVRDEEGGRVIGFGAVEDVDGDGTEDVGVVDAADSAWIVPGAAEGEVRLADADAWLVPDATRTPSGPLGAVGDGRLVLPVEVEYAGSELLFLEPSARTFDAASAAVVLPDLVVPTVAVPGDATGDGVDDLVVASYGYADYSGGVFVVPGPFDGTVDASGPVLAGVGAEGVGRSLACPDLDGDGVQDFVVGAPGVDRGAVYVAFGPFEPGGGASARAFRRDDDRYLGEGVATGDLDGDGYADIAAGGILHVWVYGGPDFPEEPVGVVTGGTDATWVGLEVAIGDVDADGRDDLVSASSWGCWGRGCAWVFSGPLAGTVSTSDATARLLGEEASSAGGGLGVADTDADGAADILVNAMLVPVDDGASGAVYRVRGGAGF